MQGYRVTVLVDRGEGKTVEHVLTANSPGGTVVVNEDGGVWSITEYSRGGNVRARVRVVEDRLVSIAEEPDR